MVIPRRLLSALAATSAVLALAAVSLAAAAPPFLARASTTAAPPPLQAPAPVVHPGHPRLIVGGYRGPTPDDLRAACASPAMQGACDAIPSGQLLPDAMRFLLHDDRAAAGRVKLSLLSGVACGDGVEVSRAGGHALAYDWVATTVSDAERPRIEGSLATCGERIVEALHGNGPHLWHGFTPQAAALAMIALALDEEPRRDALLAEAQTLFRQRALEAYAVVGGAWPEGYNYLRSHFFSGDPPHQYVLDALRAWDSAVERDHPAHASIFDTIAAEEGDWLRGLAYHVVYGTVPPYGDGGKRTLMRGGDMPTGQAWPNKQVRPYIDAIARIYDDAVLAGWGEDLEDDWAFLGGTGTYHNVHSYSLPLNLPVGVDPGAPTDLPLARIWSRDEVGYVLARSSWREDAALVGYRAGKWFTGHQHMDQGHLELWRNGPLAVDAGVYANWGTRHREAYYMRAVAHNTILVHRDGETFDAHPALPVAVNDDGQRVLTYRGLPGGNCPQCMQSVAEWRSHLGDGLHLEAGAIDAFVNAPPFMAVGSDITSAYNSTRFATPGNVAKVASMERDVVFLRPDVVVVADRVVTTPGSGPPRFVLHLPARPAEPQGDVVEGTRNDGILEAAVGHFAVDNGTGGRLVGRTLAPEAVTTTLIGGSRYRYWVDGANQLDGSRPHEAPPAEPGTWRVEIAPHTASTSTLLLHALSVLEGGSDEVPARQLEVEANPRDGAAVLAFGSPATRVLVLSRQVPRGVLRFAAFDTEAAARIVATHLEAGAEYRLASGGGSELPVRGPAHEGTWSTMARRPGRQVLGRCPPPVGATDEWVALCTDPTATPTPTSTPTVTPDVPGGTLLVPIAYAE